MKEKNNTIEKGINYATSELKMKLIEDINKSNLPITIINSMLKELSVQIESLEIQQVQKEKAEYEEKVRKEKSEEGKNQ